MLKEAEAEEDRKRLSDEKQDLKERQRAKKLRADGGATRFIPPTYPSPPVL